jgi:hypothetical protein
MKIWGDHAAIISLMSPAATPGRNSIINSSRTSLAHLPLTKEKEQPNETITEIPDDYDEEAASIPESINRPVVFTSSVMVGCGLFAIVILLFGFGVSTLIYESLEDGTYLRMVLLIFLPASMALSLFFFIVIFGNFFQAFGPISSLQLNSRYNSPVKPNLARAFAEGMTPPPITIQMPVYKEGLQGVIMPTVESLKTAISHYESFGGKNAVQHLYCDIILAKIYFIGSVRILINDDGLAYLGEDEVQKRKNFYRDNNIAWVARPQHGDKFIRKGKFKKASNMNYALNLSIKVEDEMQSRLQQLAAIEKTDLIDSLQEAEIYKGSLAQVLQDNPQAQAEGDIRIGEIILIVDSDTRVVSQPHNPLITTFGGY